jgi:hypothetical protein
MATRENKPEQSGDGTFSLSGKIRTSWSGAIRGPHAEQASGFERQGYQPLTPIAIQQSSGWQQGRLMGWVLFGLSVELTAWRTWLENEESI